MTSRPEAQHFNSSQLRSLQRLVQQGESDKLEFKRKANFPVKIIREMVAFANTSGGKLLVGVADDGTIAGVKFPDEESHVINKALANCCRPSLTFTETVIPVGDRKFVLLLDIPPSKSKPHYIVMGKTKRDSYVRQADRSIRASRELVEIMRRQRTPKDIRFNYGEKEAQLIQYLTDNSYITLADYMKLGRLSRYKASRKLILLVLANVLQIIPFERGDRYALKDNVKIVTGGM